MREQDALDRLAADLTDLGHALPTPPPRADLVDNVLLRVAGAPIPSVPSARQGLGAPTSRGALRPGCRRRWVAAAVAALGGLVLVPPVRATLLEWITLGGVTVQPTPSSTAASGATSTVKQPASSTSQPRPSVTTGDEVLDSVAQAQQRTRLEFGTPMSLGQPDRVLLRHTGRVVEMTWGAGDSVMTLDVLAGSPDYGFLKTASDTEWTDVAGNTAIWLPSGHDLQWVDRTDATQTAGTRRAGPTLVWVVPDRSGTELTYRLEGAATKAEALRLAGEVPR